MSGIENTIIARLERNGEKFEILVDPKKAYDYKTGAKKEIDNVVMVEEVFKDANKGDRQTASAIKKAFGTEDFNEIAKQIFASGELQLTTDQRRKVLAEKRLKLVELIARNAVDPRAKTPHPSARIENALEQVRFNVDPFKSVDEQLEKAIDSIREILPISLEQARIAVRIPAQYAPRCYGLVKEYGIKQEEWLNDGSLAVVIEMPAGVTGTFYDRINKATAGSAETKTL